MHITPPGVLRLCKKETPHRFFAPWRASTNGCKHKLYTWVTKLGRVVNKSCRTYKLCQRMDAPLLSPGPPESAAFTWHQQAGAPGRAQHVCTQTCDACLASPACQPLAAWPAAAPATNWQTLRHCSVAFPQEPSSTQTPACSTPHAWSNQHAALGLLVLGLCRAWKQGCWKEQPCRVAPNHILAHSYTNSTQGCLTV